MIGLEQKARLYYNKKSFFKKYTQNLAYSVEYELYIKKLDEEDDLRTILFCVEIYDILDNDGLNKLIKRLHELKKENECNYKVSNYDVKVYYRKGFLKKLQYARVQIDYNSSSLLGGIKFKNDRYIKEMDINITQINNNEFVLCYYIHFRKPFYNYMDIHECVRNNLSLIKKSSNCTFYSGNDNFFINWNYSSNDESRDESFKRYRCREYLLLEYNWLRDWLQGVIEQLLFTSKGKLYKLPILFNYNILENSESIISKLKKTDIQICFTNEAENEFLHISFDGLFEGCVINKYTIGKVSVKSSFLEYFEMNGNNFYYCIFSTIENSEIERRLGRYFTSIKRRISIGDQKWLINKIRAMKESEVHEKAIENIDIWIHYANGQKTEEKLFNYPYYQNKYLKIYSEYFEYIKSINTLNYESLILIITIITLILSFLGLL